MRSFGAVFVARQIALVLGAHPCLVGALHYPCLRSPACARRRLIRFAATQPVSVLLTMCSLGAFRSLVTFGDQAMSGGFLYQGDATSKVIWDKVWQSSRGQSVPTVRTPTLCR